MGRSSKQVISDQGLDRREFGYYSTPRFVAEFLAAELLGRNPNGSSALDPCVGKEELVGTFLNACIDVHSFDVADYGTPHRTKFEKRDFLAFYVDAKSGALLADIAPLEFDYYIANPPYNCHEVAYIRTNKERLDRAFADVGTHNMYAMFVSAIIDLAKPGALIGLVTLDSFLTSRAHRALREKIVRDCAIHVLALCPTDLFHDQGADVRTCIMVLQKDATHQGRILTSNRCPTTERFREILQKHELQSQSLDDIRLTDSRDGNEFVVACPRAIKELFQTAPRIFERFRCVTGISTGDDKRYLSSTLREGFTVPFYKNPGKRGFFAEPNGFLDDRFLELARTVPDFQVRNIGLLFKPGIVCSSMGVAFSASYLPPKATFGVNATIVCEDDDLWWLLAYLNSSLVTYVVRGVLLRGNMITSGYVSRVPVPEFASEDRASLAELAKDCYGQRGATADDCIRSIDDVVFDALGLSVKDRRLIRDFRADVVRLS